MLSKKPGGQSALWHTLYNYAGCSDPWIIQAIAAHNVLRAANVPYLPIPPASPGPAGPALAPLVCDTRGSIPALAWSQSMCKCDSKMMQMSSKLPRLACLQQKGKVLVCQPSHWQRMIKHTLCLRFAQLFGVGRMCTPPCDHFKVWHLLKFLAHWGHYSAADNKIMLETRPNVFHLCVCRIPIQNLQCWNICSGDISARAISECMPSARPTPCEWKFTVAFWQMVWLCSTGTLTHDRYDLNCQESGFREPNADGRSACGENLVTFSFGGSTSQPGNTATAMWRSSEPHYTNIINPVFRRIGLGYVVCANGQIRWTALFGM